MSDRPAPPHGRAGTLQALSSGPNGSHRRKSAAGKGRSRANLNAGESGTVVAKKDMEASRQPASPMARQEETVTVDEAAKLLGISSQETVENWLLKGFRRARTARGCVLLYRADVLAAKSERDAIADRRRRKVLDIPTVDVEDAENDVLIWP